MASIKFQLITPEKVVLNRQLTSLSVPTTTGQLTILPNHAELLATVVPGELLLRDENTTEPLHVGGGLLRVESGSVITLLADAAERVKDIDTARADEALERAKTILASEQLSDREYAATSALLERNLARLVVARKHAHRGHAGVTGEGVLEE